MGLFQPGTSLGTLSTTIGSRKTVPFRMFLMVPFGLLHIFLSLNSFTRASSGVIVAHLMPTPFACVMHATDAMVLQVMQTHARHVSANTCQTCLCSVIQDKQDYTVCYTRTHATVSMHALCVLDNCNSRNRSADSQLAHSYAWHSAYEYLKVCLCQCMLK